jgi:hypothetical protein
VAFRHVIACSGVLLALAAIGVVRDIPALMSPAILVIGLTPCLCGVAFAAIPWGPRGLRLGGVVLRGIAIAIAVSGLAVMFVYPALGILELLLGMLALAAVGAHPMTARRAAGLATACGAIGSIWFVVTATFPLVWPGASLVAAAASIGLVLGGVLWAAAPVASPLPRAVISSAHAPIARASGRLRRRV